jgi:hypothetical protein
LGGDAANPGRRCSGNAANLRRFSVRWHALPSISISSPGGIDCFTCRTINTRDAHSLNFAAEYSEISPTESRNTAFCPAMQGMPIDLSKPPDGQPRRGGQFPVKVDPKGRQRRHGTGAKENFSAGSNFGGEFVCANARAGACSEMRRPALGRRRESSMSRACLNQNIFHFPKRSPCDP